LGRAKEAADVENRLASIRSATMTSPWWAAWRCRGRTAWRSYSSR